MFEIIGIAVVAWIGFVILKGIIDGGIKGTLLRASCIAIEKGVPGEFARAAINTPEALISARKALAKENKEFASMDAYQQYAAAIIMSYKIGQTKKATEETINLSAAKEKVKNFLQPQIEELRSEGTFIHINDITFVYFAALATCEEKKGISLDQIKEIVKYVFPDKESQFMIDNSYLLTRASSDFLEKMRLILPLVNQELAQGRGHYFVKYSRKVAKEIEGMSTKIVEPREIEIDEFLRV